MSQLDPREHSPLGQLPTLSPHEQPWGKQSYMTQSLEPAFLVWVSSPWNSSWSVGCLGALESCRLCLALVFFKARWGVLEMHSECSADVNSVLCPTGDHFPEETTQYRYNDRYVTLNLNLNGSHPLWLHWTSVQGTTVKRHKSHPNPGSIAGRTTMWIYVAQGSGAACSKLLSFSWLIPH